MSKHTVMKKTVAYIEAHLEEQLSLDIIAKELNYSKYYIARVFAEHTDSTIYKYIQGRRLTLAAEKLVSGTKPIIEIAYEAGYNSQQAFTLAFHQRYSYPPQLYRKKGIFTPRQTSIRMKSSVYSISCVNYMQGGKAA